MKLLSTKSMMRYFPPNGTAGLARSLVSGCSRVPFPPASTMPNVRKRIGFDQNLLFQANPYHGKPQNGDCHQFRPLELDWLYPLCGAPTCILESKSPICPRSA